MRLRLPMFSTALILAVAACGGRDPVANGANKVTALPPAADRAAASQTAPSSAGGPPRNETAPSPAAPPAPAAIIPVALQGRWGLTPGDCTSALGDAKGLLVVNGGELRFYESRAVPAPGVQTEADSISGNFRFTGEGQTWTKFEALERQKDKLVRTETNPAASFTYAKC